MKSKKILLLILIVPALNFLAGYYYGHTHRRPAADGNELKSGYLLGTTNFLVASNYTGTVQIDDRYWTVHELRSQQWSQYSTDIKHLDAQIAYFEGVQESFRALNKYLKTNAFSSTNAHEIESYILSHEP